jgi:hypothetical protein
MLSPRKGQLVQDSGEYLFSTTRSAASCLKRNGIPECCCPVRGEITGLEIGSGQDCPQLGCRRAPSRIAVRRSAGRAGSWCVPGHQELPRSARRVRHGHRGIIDPVSAGWIRSRIGAPTGKRPSGAALRPRRGARRTREDPVVLLVERRSIGGSTTRGSRDRGSAPVFGSHRARSVGEGLA